MTDSVATTRARDQATLTADNGSKRFTDSLPDEPATVELSLVVPCLNEADTLGACIDKAQRALARHRISGEIIIADNGSTDGSQEIAERLGVRLVTVTERGYGSALMAGISAARGKYVLMGDADDSYDFGELSQFIAPLRDGYELVQGCRLPRGGGRVEPGAMPWLHRWWGNPMFSSMARSWFGAPIHDVYCGMRAFRRDFYEELGLRCTGMEFATEMIIKASLRRARIAEVPITLYPDGRRAHAPHLRTFRDGWRTLRFFLVYSPRWLFLLPGLFMMLVGFFGYAIALPGLSFQGVTFDVHTLLFASLASIAGYQSVLFAIATKVFAITEGLLPADERLTRFFKRIDLERGLLVGACAVLAGLLLLANVINDWRVVDFGRLDYARTLRWAIPGMTLTTIGLQTILSGFFVSILGMKRR